MKSAVAQRKARIQEREYHAADVAFHLALVRGDRQRRAGVARPPHRRRRCSPPAIRSHARPTAGPARSRSTRRSWMPSGHATRRRRATRCGPISTPSRSTCASTRAGSPGTQPERATQRIAEPVGEAAAHARPQAQERARHWLARELRGAEPVLGRGDVEVAEVGAAEGQARRVGHRQRDLDVETAAGVVAPYRSAAEQRDPDAALGVDGEPVGEPVGGVDGRERPPRSEPAAVDVEVDRVDALGRRVDVEEPRRVEIPVEPVRDRRALDGGGDVSVVRDAVQGRLAGSALRRHRPRPEAAASVARRVVEPVAGPVGLDRRQHPRWPPEEVQLAADAGDQARVGPGQREARPARDERRLSRPSRRRALTIAWPVMSTRSSRRSAASHTGHSPSMSVPVVTTLDVH